jgi:hypothetical protein
LCFCVCLLNALLHPPTLCCRNNHTSSNLQSSIDNSFRRTHPSTTTRSPSVQVNPSIAASSIPAQVPHARACSKPVRCLLASASTLQDRLIVRTCSESPNAKPPFARGHFRHSQLPRSLSLPPYSRGVGSSVCCLLFDATAHLFRRGFGLCEAAPSSAQVGACP